MSQQETRCGRIRLVPNIPGEETYEKKARELADAMPVPEKDVKDIADYFAEGDWQQGLLEADYYRTDKKKFHDPTYEILNDQIYEVLENVDLSDDGGFCKLTRNEDGTISFIASWYNGGASLSEVLEDELESLDQ